MQQEQVVFGIHPVREAMKGGGGKIQELVVAPGRRGTALKEILAMASHRNVPVVFRDRSTLDALTGGGSHQGVVARCEPFAYAMIDAVLAERSGTASVVLILDGVSDPQNLGAVIRTAYCLGARGVVIPEHRAVGVTPAVVKASAGAAHWIPVVRAVNLVQTLALMQERGFWIYGADAQHGKDINTFADDGPVGLVLGSEGRGLRSLVRKKCDFLLSIPVAGEIGSLNVSVAAGIILYEMVTRQGRRR